MLNLKRSTLSGSALIILILPVTLSWQAPSYSLYSSNPYRVQIDNDPAFGSIDRDYYTSKTTYSPSLDLGNWYWRVEARDINGIWSSFSTPIFFTVTESPSPLPSPPKSPSPLPTAASPKPVSTPKASSSTQTSSNIFNISNIPLQIDVNQSFQVPVNISLHNNPNTKYFLKGAFSSPSSSNYFGQTQVSGSWVKNNQTFSSQLGITTDSNGDWNGTLTVMPDPEDSGYTGSDSYIFKVGRYNASGSGLTWSNQSGILITGNKPQVSPSTTTDSLIPTSSSNTPSGNKTNLASNTDSVLAAEYNPLLPPDQNNLDLNTLPDMSTTAANLDSSPPPTIIESEKTSLFNFYYIIPGIIIFLGTFFYIIKNTKKEYADELPDTL